MLPRSVIVETRCRFSLPSTELLLGSKSFLLLPFYFATQLMQVLSVKGLETGSSSGQVVTSSCAKATTCSEKFEWRQRVPTLFPKDTLVDWSLDDLQASEGLDDLQAAECLQDLQISWWSDNVMCCVC